ncbi:MAG: hypothetical protein GY899_05680 [Verrucomicrobiaceae bacterium]|nr:hypothetical protein [Verrucomicrobiaceae bacterium]
MSNLSLMAGILAVILVFLSSCKTVRRVTHVESRGASDPLTRRFVGGSVERWESGKAHAMGQKQTSAGKLFGGTGENIQFGGNYRAKEYGGSEKKFSGSKAFKTGNYRSTNQWRGADKSAAAAKKKFLGSKASAGEGKRKWFGSNRQVVPKSAREGGKRLQLKMWRGVIDAPEGKRSVEIERVKPSASSSAAGQLSIEEVRGILER